MPVAEVHWTRLRRWTRASQVLCALNLAARGANVRSLGFSSTA